ncbi:MAG: hypothetical protein R3Y26_08660 [Rikenellaceae bacterium]
MKKLLSLGLLLIMSFSTVYASQSSSSDSSDESTTKSRPKSGLEVDYVISDSGNGIGGSLVLGFLALGGEYLTDSGLDGNLTNWQVNAGINKKYISVASYIQIFV